MRWLPIIAVLAPTVAWGRDEYGSGLSCMRELGAGMSVLDGNGTWERLGLSPAFAAFNLGLSVGCEGIVGPYEGRITADLVTGYFRDTAQGLNKTPLTITSAFLWGSPNARIGPELVWGWLPAGAGVNGEVVFGDPSLARIGLDGRMNVYWSGGKPSGQFMLMFFWGTSPF